MMKLLSLVCIFTAIAYQLALAQGYTYESMGHSVPEYVEVDGVRYARIPEKKKQVYSPPIWELNDDTQNVSNFKRDVINTKWLSLYPYLGVEGALGRGKYKEELDKYLFEKDMRRLGLFAGLHLNQYISLEAFYNLGEMPTKKHHIDTSISDATISSVLDFDAYGIDVLGYVPIASVADIILGLGYGWYEFDGKTKISIYNKIVKIDGSVTFSGKTKAEAVRFGLGTQFYITEDWALRLLGRYIHFTDDKVIKNMMELSVGLRYLF